MVDLMNYAEKNDVEVSVRKGHDGRTAWEFFLRDRRLGITEFTRIIDIEIRGKLNKDAYIEMRLESMMDHIRGERMRRNYADIEGAQLPRAIKRSARPEQQFEEDRRHECIEASAGGNNTKSEKNNTSHASHNGEKNAA